MFRTAPVLALLAAAGLAHAGPRARAAQPVPQQPLPSAAAAAPTPRAEPLIVRLLDQQKEPVQGARVTVHVEPVGELVALRGWLPPNDAFAEAMPSGASRSGTTDARGELRLDAGASAGVATASGWATTESGLGALLVDLRAGRGQRVDMQPMAAVTTDGESELLRVFARAMLPDGRAVTFAPPPSRVVKLPAGDYELWISTADGWSWQRCGLRTGERRVVELPRVAVRVRSAALLHPAGRPDVPLLVPPAAADGSSLGEAALLGDAARAPLVALWRAPEPAASALQLLGPHALAPSGAAQPVRWPAADAVAGGTPTRLVVGADTAGPVALFGLVRHGDASWRLAAASLGDGRNGNERTFTLPRPPDADAALLLVAAGHAPQAFPWKNDGPPDRLVVRRGVALALHVQDESGTPIENLELEYAPTDMEPAAVAARSDDRGIASFGPVLAPGVLRVVDPRFANMVIELMAVPVEPPTLKVAAGSALRGLAKWSDGTPAASVLVTLRDPTGLLRPAQRATTSGGDGAFTFGGLPADRPLVLFALAQRDGRTWSGKLAGLRAGADDTIELILRDEDPQLLPPAK